MWEEQPKKFFGISWHGSHFQSLHTHFANAFRWSTHTENDIHVVTGSTYSVCKVQTNIYLQMFVSSNLQRIWINCKCLSVSNVSFWRLFLLYIITDTLSTHGHCQLKQHNRHHKQTCGHIHKHKSKHMHACNTCIFFVQKSWSDNYIFHIP